MPAWKESVRQGSPSWPGHDTWTTGHAGGGGSQAPASTVVTVKVASTFPPRPSVTVTRTSCGPRRRLFRSQTTNLPLPEMDPSVVEYWYRSLSPSASVAVTSRSTSGLANKWDHGQISTLVIDELKESITGGLLRCRRGFCCEAVTTGNNRATKITIRRFTNPSLQLRSRSLKSLELIQSANPGASANRIRTGGEIDATVFPALSISLMSRNSTLSVATCHGRYP